MNFSKEVYQKIWEAALPYQDKRDDVGHGEIVTKFAIKLCELEEMNDNIVIPAAILHDIGWSQLPEKERFHIFDSDITKEQLREIQIKHEQEGVKLAEKILSKIGYPSGFIKTILEIISQHDTRSGFFSKEDGTMRDADKLWRFSKIGFDADIRRRGVTFNEWHNYLEKNIDEQGFFFSESAKLLAREELKDRKKGT